MQSLLSGGQPQAPAPEAPKKDGMLHPKQFFHLQKAILGKFIKLCWNCNEINFHNQNKFQISDDQKYISCNTVFCISCARGNMENSIQKFAARNKDNSVWRPETPYGRSYKDDFSSRNSFNKNYNSSNNFGANGSSSSFVLSSGKSFGQCSSKSFGQQQQCSSSFDRQEESVEDQSVVVQQRPT
jgi:hypothetical protein